MFPAPAEGVNWRNEKKIKNFSELEEHLSLLFVVLTVFNQYLLICMSTTGNCNHHSDFPSRKNNNLLITENTFPVEMATLSKRKLAALNRKNCEEHPRNKLGKNSNVPR